MPKKIIEDPKFVGVWLPGKMKESLNAEAEEAGASVSSRIRRIIEDHFNGQKTSVVSFLGR